MNPYEETWEVSTYGGIHVGTSDAHPRGQTGDLLFAKFEDEARAKLAAQAPAMARLLLELRPMQGDGYTKDIEAVLRDAGVLL